MSVGHGVWDGAVWARTEEPVAVEVVLDGVWTPVDASSGEVEINPTHISFGPARGDGIMAFWGAPNPVAQHPLEGCRAALACQHRLTELRARWTAEGKPDLFTRIGVHTGDMIVGNMGSENRLNYTVIGDAVNVAARLEALAAPKALR